MDFKELRINEELFKKTLKDIIEEFAKDNNLKIIMHFPHSSLDILDSFFDLCIGFNEEWYL